MIHTRTRNPAGQEATLRTLRSWSSMNSEMYSGARGDRLMKASNAALSAFWNVLSLANAAPTILRACREPDQAPVARREQEVRLTVASLGDRWR